MVCSYNKEGRERERGIRREREALDTPQTQFNPRARRGGREEVELGDVRLRVLVHGAADLEETAPRRRMLLSLLLLLLQLLLLHPGALRSPFPSW